MAPATPLGERCIENWARALHSEGSGRMMPVSPETKMEIPVTEANMPRKTLITLLLLAIGVRILWALLSHPVIEEEGVYYAHMAENLVKGKLFFSFADQPLFTLLIAGFHYFGLDSEFAGRCISIGFGAALLLPMALIALRLYGREVAYIVAGLSAFHPFLICISTCVLSEATFLFFLMLGIYFVLSSLAQAGRYRPALSGFLFGLAYLTRVEGIVFPFLSALFLYFIGIWPKRELLRQTLTMIAAFLLLVIPYVIFLSYHMGHISIEGKSDKNYAIQRNLAVGIPVEESLFKISDSLEDQSIQAALKSGNIKISLRDKIIFAVRSGRASIHELMIRLMTSACLGEPLLLLYVIVGLFRSAWSRERLLQEGFLLLGVGMLVVAYGGAGSFFRIRHLVCFLAISLLWAGKGVNELFVWAKDSFQPKSARVIGLRIMAYVTMLGTLFVVSLFGTLRIQSYDVKGNLVDKEIGISIRKTMPDLGSVMDTNPFAAFYSGKELLPFPYCDSKVALKYIEKSDVSVLILRTSNTSRPYLKAWIENGIPDSRAELVRSWTANDGGIINVYRWNSGSG